MGFFWTRKLRFYYNISFSRHDSLYIFSHHRLRRFAGEHCRRCIRADSQQSSSDTTSVRADSATKAVLAQSSAGHIIWHDIKEGAYDGLQYVERPLHWNVKEWGIMTTGVGLAVALEFADKPIQTIVLHNQNKFGDDLSMFGNNFYGDGYATGLTFISLYTIGIATDDNELRVMGRK